MTEKVTIELTKDEALVLFDFLGRFNQKANESDFEDQAEQITLWNVECVLETILVEPFMPNYEDILKHSREKIRDGK
ncbi:hypothetical protein [Flavobacterium sp. CAN_S2]|uniref:hypothetical protein n=1 Tax=Flavobacterium sp. CAN_S2 TaxID=2787726 RepID=UPI0018CA6B3A